jgi:ribonuclease inhibitor
MESRNPERIPLSLRAIEEVWRQSPDLRLGQLLLNAMENPQNGSELYFIEDDRLLKKLGVRNPPAVRPIANPPVIDLRDASDERDVHAAFASVLCFPGFYGMNWDAFWDVLTGFGCFPPKIIILGREALTASTPRTVEMLEKIFKEYETENNLPPLIVEWR